MWFPQRDDFPIFPPRREYRQLHGGLGLTFSEPKLRGCYLEMQPVSVTVARRDFRGPNGLSGLW